MILVASGGKRKAAPGGAGDANRGPDQKETKLLMASEDPTRTGALDTLSQDRRTERAVLALVLDEHPTRLTLTELVLALCGDGPSDEDAVRRAVDELASAGLLHRDGSLFGPTRPAIYFDRLGMA